jgi:hypothetical protein
LNARAPVPVLTVEVHDKDGIELSLERVKRLMKRDG